MKKNIKIIGYLLIIIATILCTKNVKAVQFQDEELGFKINLNTVKYNIYKIDSSQEETIEYNEEGEIAGEELKLTVDDDNFVKEVYTKSIIKEKTINPQYKYGNISGKRGLLVNLNIPLEATEVEGLLAEAELPEPTDTVSYYIDYVVDFEIVEVPDGFNYWCKVDALRVLMNQYYTENLSGHATPPITGSQVINRIRVLKDSETGNTSYYYSNSIEEDTFSAIDALSYLLLSETEIDDAAAENANDLILFHSYDNIDKLIELTAPNDPTIDDEDPDNNEIGPDDVNSGTEVTTDDDGEVIKVENTAQFRNKVILGVSIILIVLGVSTISFVMKKKDKE